MKASQTSSAPITFRFGEKIIPSSQVFIARKHVYAMVNVRPMVPGHVIVCPTRVVQHFRSLTELETLELFVCAKEIAKLLELCFQIKNFSFIIQDGDSAGQQIKHAHMHIIPRDDTSGQDLKHIKFENLVERNASEMAEEAETIRNSFEKKRQELKEKNITF